MNFSIQKEVRGKVFEKISTWMVSRGFWFFNLFQNQFSRQPFEIQLQNLHRNLISLGRFEWYYTAGDSLTTMVRW